MSGEGFLHIHQKEKEFGTGLPVNHRQSQNSETPGAHSSGKFAVDLNERMEVSMRPGFWLLLLELEEKPASPGSLSPSFPLTLSTGLLHALKV